MLSNIFKKISLNVIELLFLYQYVELRLNFIKLTIITNPDLVKVLLIFSYNSFISNTFRNPISLSMQVLPTIADSQQ